MKILLFGKNGQVGWELNRSLQVLGDVVVLSKKEADFSKPEQLRDWVRKVKPDVIVNAVAYTAVDKAETEEDLAAVINGRAPGVLAEETLRINALLIHYSTDYVFDGTKETPYVETDDPNPINAYGRTKLAGENRIISSGCDYLIFRTSWVYAARGSNFLRTVLRLSKERAELRIVADQFGAPTWARNIADATVHAIVCAHSEWSSGGFASNIYHLSAKGKTSWYGFTESIIEQIKQSGYSKNIITKSVVPIATGDYPLPAQRPKNSLMDSKALSNRFGIIMPEWDVAVRLCAEEVLSA